MHGDLMPFSVKTGTDYDEINSPALDLKVLRCGAEPFSLKLHHPQLGDVGLLLNDDQLEADHHYWKSHAPFLFPIVGGLVGGKSVTGDGREIALGGHGFARTTTFALCDSGSNDHSAWLEYFIDNSMVAWSDTNKYPWKFRFGVRFVITGNRLYTEMKVRNLDNAQMWYQLGWHPGFHTPVDIKHGSRNDVELLLPKGECPLYECDRDSFLTGKVETIKTGGAFHFDDRGLDYTYVLDMNNYADRWAALRDPHSGITTKVLFPDLPHLGLWAMPDSPYICIEPWQGADDFTEKSLFEKKFGIASLLPGENDSRTVTVEISFDDGNKK